MGKETSGGGAEYLPQRDKGLPLIREETGAAHRQMLVYKDKKRGSPC